MYLLIIDIFICIYIYIYIERERERERERNCKKKIISFLIIFIWGFCIWKKYSTSFFML